MICRQVLIYKEKVIGGSILGSDRFINWVKDKFLPSKSREIPAVQRLKKYTAKDKIIDALCKETKKSSDEIKTERGIIRQIAMDLFYRVDGLSGTVNSKDLTSLLLLTPLLSLEQIQITNRAILDISLPPEVVVYLLFRSYIRGEASYFIPRY